MQIQQDPNSLSVRQVYDLALKTEQAGEDAEAELICRKALPSFGTDPNILSLLAEVVLKQRRPQEARRWFEKVLKLHPDYPRALEGLGKAYLKERKAGKALKYLQLAAEKLPNRATTQFALGRALASAGHGVEADKAFDRAFELDPKKAAVAKAVNAQRDGQIDVAEKILRSVLTDDPDDVTALRLLGNIAADSNRWGAARKMLTRAVKLAPDFILAWGDLAMLSLKQERFEEGLEHIGHAISLDAKLPYTYVIKGNILAKAQRHDEALKTYQQAIDLSPGHGGALSGQGHVLKTIGRQEESIATYRECLKNHPALGEAYWSLANLKTFEFNPEEVETMLALVEDETLEDEAKVNMLLSLGKHFENEKEYDKAFEHYQRGNDLRRGHEVYDPVQTQVIHDRIIKVFDREFIEGRDGSGDPDPSPILIVGLPRSGSTLIEQILASHSQVEGTMELPDLARVIKEINRARKDRIEFPEAMAELSLDDLKALGGQYLKSTMRYRTGKPYFIDKMPNNFPSIGLLHLILPNAKVINARRHPLDSCMGCYKQLFYRGQSFTYDQFELGQYYIQYQRVMDHWHDVLPGRVLDVQYEEMVLNQEAQTRRLLEYCGLPWEDQVMRFYETERAINTASSEQVRQPIYKGAMNFWKNYEEHLGEMIEILEPLLIDLPEEDRPKALQN
ncbi:MAG: tetratricopeptide (TPR) repeat protein [Lysobacterales bacterium]|jgi:tetratricopeptide (TPR) repeat protein